MAAASLNSLALVEFLAAVHIFSYQTFSARLGFFQHATFQLWAPSWYAFLFAAEGFRSTHAQLKGPSPEDMGPIVPFLQERAVKLYPAYLVSTALLLAFPGSGGRPVTWSAAAANAVPVSTWIGTTPDGWDEAWNDGAWVLSDLALHALCWRFVYPRLAQMSEASCWCTLGGSLLFTYVRTLFLALGVITHLALWAPYTFCHFLSGMCLAKIFVARGTGVSGTRDCLLLELWPYRFPFSGTLAVIVAFSAVFWGASPDDVLSRSVPYAMRLGVLMPLHLLLIWALALEEGPISAFCRTPPVGLLGGAAHAMFVLHWNVVSNLREVLGRIETWEAVQRLTGKQKFVGIILPATCALALAVHVLVERPLQRAVRKRSELLYPEDE